MAPTITGKDGKVEIGVTLIAARLVDGERPDAPEDCPMQRCSSLWQGSIRWTASNYGRRAKSTVDFAAQRPSVARVCVRGRVGLMATLQCSTCPQQKTSIIGRASSKVAKSKQLVTSWFSDLREY